MSVQLIPPENGFVGHGFDHKEGHNPYIRNNNLHIPLNFHPLTTQGDQVHVTPSQLEWPSLPLHYIPSHISPTQGETGSSVH